MSKMPPLFTSTQGESLLRKYELWVLLRRLKKEYEAQYTGYYEPTHTGHRDSLDKWLENECGLRVYFDHDGMILGHVDIIDEAKYAWTLLKYK